MASNTQTLQVGVLLFADFELLDVFGPLELFGLLGDRVAISMLADTPEVASNAGPRVVADTIPAEAGQLDVLLVPGGVGTRTMVSDRAFIEQLARLCRQSRIVASVCTGSALLARTGLLDGKEATSNKIAFGWAMEQGPAVRWVRKARWVEDSSFFTSSGISAGMDMTLGLIEHVFDRDTAREIAGRAEYLWNRDKSLDPFA